MKHKIAVILICMVLCLLMLPMSVSASTDACQHEFNLQDCTYERYCSQCKQYITTNTEHSWGEWQVGTGSSHIRYCTNYNCIVVDGGNHTGGTATCTEKAICTACGTAYGEKNPQNHSGGTEVKNAVAAGEFTEGYTGDTYCKGCGEMLEKGEVIPASHVHSYGAEWKSDGINHWHECSCGEKSGLEVHIPGAPATETAPQTCTACGYELSPVVVPTPMATPIPDTSGLPQTGDDSRIGLWLLLLGVSSVTLIAAKKHAHN